MGRKVAEMTNYRAILLYYSKGNTTTQIATICDCSRTTVIRAVKRAKAINLSLPVSDKIKDEELYFMLYPKRGPNKEYYRPDFYLLNKDKKKRGFTKYRAWQKYCRVAKREGFPNCITTINAHAFFCCTNLASINLPEGLTTIGEGRSTAYLSQA